MKTTLNHKLLKLHRHAFLFGGTLMLAVITGCGSGSSGSSADSTTTNPATSDCAVSASEIETLDKLPEACLSQLPQPENSLDGEVFVLGTRIDHTDGWLEIYAHGTHSDGTPISLEDFRQTEVLVNELPVDAQFVTINPVDPSDDILSVGLVTDYSGSIDQTELDAITDIYGKLFNELPEVYEAQVINFSSSVFVVQDWTEDQGALLEAVKFDDSLSRNYTALYDAIGTALEGNTGVLGDGLAERLRPAHMLILHTDGIENASFTYHKETLKQIVADDKTIVIMLGTRNADKAELEELAGDRGAFVYAHNVIGIDDALKGWLASMNNLVEIRISPDTRFADGPVVVTIDGISVPIDYL
jgi:hypothetical protein